MKELRGKVGLVFQYPEHQLFEADVLTDVCFGPRNLGCSEAETKKRALHAFRRPEETRGHRRRSGHAAPDDDSG